MNTAFPIVPSFFVSGQRAVSGPDPIFSPPMTTFGHNQTALGRDDSIQPRTDSARPVRKCRVPCGTQSDWIGLDWTGSSFGDAVECVPTLLARCVPDNPHHPADTFSPTGGEGRDEGCGAWKGKTSKDLTRVGTMNRSSRREEALTSFRTSSLSLLASAATNARSRYSEHLPPLAAPP
jgi:hypothetical protein